MGHYLFVRSLQGVATLLVISTVIFLLGRLTGDPLDLIMPMQATEKDYKMMRQAIGLDKPLYVQYGIFMRDFLQGDWGLSIKTREPVKKIIARRLVASAKLAAVSILITVVMSFPLAVIAAKNKDSWLDVMVRLFTFLGQSMPTFWVGLMLLILFSGILGWLPSSGIGGPLHYVLPGFTLGWFVVAGAVRLLRSSMIDALDSEYVLMAKVKGVSDSMVVWKHALRNALIPIVTFAGFYFAILIGSAVIVETVFAWPGIGRLMYDAVMWHDFPVLQSAVLVISVIVIMVNLLVDIIYSWIDPRIRY